MNIGRFKHVCADCGTVAMMRRCDFNSKTHKPRCRGCGGTFFQPASRNAMIDFSRRSIAGNVKASTNRDHRAVLTENTIFAYKGTKAAKGSGRSTAALPNSHQPVVVNEIIAAPQAEPLHRDYTMDIVVKPLGTAKKRNKNIAQ